jgi:germacradienol/geosmin synthase
MPVESDTMPEPATPLERGLADLWLRTAGSLSTCDRARLRTSIEDMVDSWLWELANHIQNRIPDPVDYIEMRRKTFGSDLTKSLSRISHGSNLPDEIYRSRPFTGMEDAAADYACFMNDVFSYQKEIQFEGELHNCILVVQNFLNTDKDTALAIVNDLMTGRMRQFERITGSELAALADDFGLDDVGRDALFGYGRELQHWMAGIRNWHEGCHRYDESELRYHPVASAEPFGGPTGLGTASVRFAKAGRARE